MKNSASNILSYGIAFMLAISIVLPHFFGASVLLYIGLLIKYGIQKELYFKISILGFLWISFYSIYVLGAIWTNNLEIALKTFEYKAAFVLFPLLLGFRPKSEQINLPVVFQGLIVGVLLTSLIGIANSILCYLDGGGRTCFLTVFISPTHHPTYFVMYWIVAISAAWYGWSQKWTYFKLNWIIPFSILGLVFHVLSLSLAGLLYLVVLSYGLIAIKLFRSYGKWIGVLGIFVLPLLSFLFLTKVPQVEGEWHAAKWYADEYMKNPRSFVESRKYPMSGSEERLVLWTVSFEEIMKHPLGVGTGNTEEVLSSALRNVGQSELAELNRNSHNQYLQTSLELGIFGLIILLSIIFYSIYLGFKNRNPLLIILVSCFAFNCLFESILQRQSGVVFFVLMVLIISRLHDENNLIKETDI